MSDLSACAAVITAAGLSSRMGTPKALLDWGGVPLLLHQLSRLDRFGEVVVVTGSDAELLRRFIRPPAREAFNPEFAGDRILSLLCGFKALLSPFRAVLVCGVDQPISEGLPAALFASLGEHPYAYPSFGGRKGHPVLFHRDLFPELLRLGDGGLREIVRRHAAEAVNVPWASPLVSADLNTPEDLAILRDAKGETRA